MNATNQQQPSIKTLANRVLQRNRQCNQSATETSRPSNFDATGATNEHNPRHGIQLAELRDLAGKDWPELEANPVLLECFADMVAIRKMREHGDIPPRYTATTVCRYCGLVPIFPGVAEKVEGCPWCMNRAAGRPIPRSKKPNPLT